jgi:transposase-like protein
MKSFEVIHDSVEGVGVKKVAAAMNVSASLVYKWCEAAAVQGEPDEASGALNPLDRVAVLWECTRDAALIDWLCHRAGGTFVPDSTRDTDVDAAYVERTQKLVRDFSELQAAVSQSMINDGHVDPREAEHIRRHWQVLKRHAESFVAACEQGLYDKGCTA